MSQAEIDNLQKARQAVRDAGRSVVAAARDLRWAACPRSLSAEAVAPVIAAASQRRGSLAARIALLAHDFDPTRRDEDFGDTGSTPRDTAASVHVADDGRAYWGNVDNESARAKAAGQTLIIDQNECIHCGTCVENTAAVFVLPDDSKAVAYRQEGPMDLVQDAIDACPVTCIHWTADVAIYPQLNDEAGNKV